MTFDEYLSQVLSQNKNLRKEFDALEAEYKLKRDELNSTSKEVVDGKSMTRLTKRQRRRKS